jgi:hypothetical protein
MRSTQHLLHPITNSGRFFSALQAARQIVVAAVAVTAVGCLQLPESLHFPPAPPPVTPEQIADTAQAVTLLRNMADFLAGQQRLSTTAEVAYSAVQEDGQKIEFGGNRRLTIRRPDRARIESRARDGVTRFVYFDSGTLSAVVPDQKIYASAEIPTQLDKAIDFVVQELEIPMPLAELVHPDFLSQGIDRIGSGFVVGEEGIDGVRCEHLAFRGEAVDFEVWVAHGAAPLPKRIVIRYRDEPGAPEFWVHFERWNLAPEVPDEIFLFTPPPNATEVSFDELLDRVPLRAGGEDE